MATTKKPTLVLPSLHPYQAEIAMSRAKIRVLACGRRAGKTTLGNALCLTAALSGYPVAWAAPTYSRSRAMWRMAVNATAQLRKAGLVSINKSDRIIEFEGGGHLALYSLDGSSGDAMRGEHFGLVCIDEAAYISIDGFIEAVVLPCLADLDGELILVSSPNGLSEFFHWYTLAQNDTTGYMQAWRYSTLINPDPKIQAAYHRAKKTTTDRRFRQEWDAEFLEDGAGVFTNVRECATASRRMSRQEGHTYCIGADLARVAGGDNSVFSVLDLSQNPPALVRQDVYNGMDFDQQIKRLKILYEAFGASRLIIEQTGISMPIVEQLRKDRALSVSPFKTTNETKATLVDDLALAFEQGKIAILNDEQLINELLAFTAVQLPSGSYRFTAPPGMHDDRVISLALAYKGAIRRNRATIHGSDVFTTGRRYSIFPDERGKLYHDSMEWAMRRAIWPQHFGPED